MHTSAKPILANATVVEQLWKVMEEGALAFNLKFMTQKILIAVKWTINIYHHNCSATHDPRQSHDIKRLGQKLPVKWERRQSYILFYFYFLLKSVPQLLSISHASIW